ncbi:ABC-2 family transporter protein [Actinoplanes sp. NPDC026670]|uniref:ABC transporter permease n=1 Tax=Actinoplanes sp. NPDC026670 TaxID=3154700 RepID=UPI0033E80D7E
MNIPGDLARTSPDEDRHAGRPPGTVALARLRRRRFHALRLTWCVTKVNFRASLEYRGDFLLAIVSGIIWQASVLVLATVLVNRFPNLAGWTKGEILLVAALRLLSHGLYVAGFASLAALPRIVQEGKVETFMLRPLSVYRQVLFDKLFLNAIGDLAVAVTLFTIAVPEMDVDWTAQHVGYLILAVAGGVFLEASLHTVIACFALRSISTIPWSQWIDELLATFGSYPLKIFPLNVQVLFTFVIPIAFIGYVPAAQIAGKTADLPFPPWLALAAPFVGILAFTAARLLFAAGLRKYTGVGGV